MSNRIQSKYKRRAITVREKAIFMENVFAGIDIGGTRIKLGLAESKGRLISCETLETAGFRDAENLFDSVRNTIQTLAHAASVSVLAAGIGCPGRIDFVSGRVVWLKSKLEFLEGILLGPLLGERLGCPVVCDNDVNTMLSGEMRFGAGRGHREVVAVTLGTGIGGAMVLDGQMVRGHNWAAGRFGYMSLNPRGPRHICGNNGVVEDLASQSGVLDQLRGASAMGKTSHLTELLVRGERTGLREVFEWADAGDALGRRLAKGVTCGLGVLIANLIFALDPEVILLGGGVIAHSDDVLEAIRREVAGRVDFLPRGATKIEPMMLGDTAGVMGGVALAMDAFQQRQVGLRAQGEEG